MPLLAEYQKWVARAQSSRARLLTFQCLSCDSYVKTSAVPGDTLSTCPYCAAVFFKVTNADGTVEVFERSAAA